MDRAGETPTAQGCARCGPGFDGRRTAPASFRNAQLVSLTETQVKSFPGQNGNSRGVLWGTGWSGGPFLCVSEPSGKGAGVWWVCPGQTWSGDTEPLAYVWDPSGELNVACSVNRKGTGQPWLLVRRLPTLVSRPSPYHVLIPHQPGTAFSKERGLLRRPPIQEQGLPRPNHL